MGYWQAVACPRAAHETATCRICRSPTGSTDAIGWHNPNLNLDSSLHLRLPMAPGGNARTSGCVRTNVIFTKEKTQ